MCPGIDGNPVPQATITADEDADLLRRVAADDASAEERLWEKYRPRVVFLLLRRVFGRQDVAEDLAQEAMSALTAAIREERLVDSSKVGAYLFGTCAKLTNRWRIRHARETSIEGIQPTAPDDDPEDTYIEKETRVRLMQAFDELPEKDREVLLQRFAKEFSFAQIARNLGLTGANARQRSRRAVNKLRDLLGPE